MLCGAHDANEISSVFSEVVRDFGAVPWWYLNGKIWHLNSASSSWSENSRATVRKVDVCVFVILNSYGEITWSEELKEALNLGKPFVVLALESAWNRYNTIRYSVDNAESLLSEDDKQMLTVLQLIADHEFTVIPFSYGTFKNLLREALSDLMSSGLELLSARIRRRNLIDTLATNGSITQTNIKELVALATDDYHDSKSERKSALKKIAASEYRSNELTLDACKSFEQGIQRLAFHLIPFLAQLPLEVHLLRELSQISLKSDDIGLARRLANSIGDVDPYKLDILIEEMPEPEEGVRRRAYEAAEAHMEELLASWGIDRMKWFLNACEAKTTSKPSWLVRLRETRDKLA